jgi:glycosyltransferase involved in cell wall biosynthesis
MKEKQKILFFDFKIPYLLKDENYPVGGATIELNTWMEELKSRGLQVCVLTWRGAESYLDNDNFCIVESYSPNISFWKFTWVYKYIKLFNAIKANNPDILIQECAGSITGVLANIAKLLSIPFVYRVANDMEVDERIEQRLSFMSRILFSYGLKKASIILCQNNFQYAELFKRLPDAKLCLIPTPFNFNGDILPIKDYSERKYIAWIGVFQYQKNLPLLCNIVKKNMNLKFKIAGQSANYKLDSETEASLKCLRKFRNVEFVGYLSRDEVPLFLQSAYVLLNTSHYEGFPLTYIEALSMGTPIITTDKCDPDNFVNKNNLGFVYHSGESLNQNLYKIFELDSYNIMAHKCRDYVLKNHEAGILSKRLVSSINSID